MFKKIILTLILISSPQVSLGGNNYRIEFLDNSSSTKRFVLEMNSSNPDALGIESLEYYLSEGVQLNENQDPVIGLMTGEIEATQASLEHGWSFRFKPGTIEFTDMAKESCDANFQFIEDHFEAWMIEQEGFFCPWGTASWIQKIEKNGHLLWQRP